MADPLTQLKEDLELLAKPDAASPAPNKWSGQATAGPVLPAVEGLFDALKGVSGLTAVIAALGGALEAGFDDVADALVAIAEHIATLPGNPAEVGKALTGLQNALSTASSLVPGGANTAALQSGGQIFEHLSKLLESVPSFEAAADLLYEIAQQLKEIGGALKTASGA
jgi:ABC-type transporter Mla subunit MlaD